MIRGKGTRLLALGLLAAFAAVALAAAWWALVAGDDLVLREDNPRRAPVIIESVNPAPVP